MQTIKEMFLAAMGQGWPGFEKARCEMSWENFDSIKLALDWFEKLLAEKGDCYLTDHIPDATKKVEQLPKGEWVVSSDDSSYECTNCYKRVRRIYNLDVADAHDDRWLCEECLTMRYSAKPEQPVSIAVEEHFKVSPWTHTYQKWQREHDRLLLAAAREQLVSGNVPQPDYITRRELIEALREAWSCGEDISVLADRLEGKKC